jgi:hypothetical protein
MMIKWVAVKIGLLHKNKVISDLQSLLKTFLRTFPWVKPLRHMHFPFSSAQAA